MKSYLCLLTAALSISSAAISQPLLFSAPGSARAATSPVSRKAGSVSGYEGLKWQPSGHLYTKIVRKKDSLVSIISVDPGAGFKETILATAADLTPAGAKGPLNVDSYTWKEDQHLLLLFTDSRRVWRAKTRGNYWIYDTGTKKLSQAGEALPPSSLQFAKLSPDGLKLAFVSKHNLYMQEIASGRLSQLTHDGTDRIINGTFDWAYEEELDCRDGFRWSPDSKNIAYWQVDARAIRNFLMINNTDSVYSFTVPVEYPKVGYDPSSVRIGVVAVGTAATSWLAIPGDPKQHYLPRMAWAPGSSSSLIVQQFNRKQNTTVLYLADTRSGIAKPFFTESDPAWVELSYQGQYDRVGWDWIKGNKSFLWLSEKDGWRHIYRISASGKDEALITKGNYDVIEIKQIDQLKGLIYFTASPENATQVSLYSISLKGSAKPVRISPAAQKGTHEYSISADGNYAVHGFSSHLIFPITQFLSLQPYKVLSGDELSAKAPLTVNGPVTRFLKITTADKVEMDVKMILPAKFDSAKKYPVLFNVYGEPAAALVKDEFSYDEFHQGLADSGYVVITVDNRGTPSPKGREWRKSIYRNIGRINAADQAAAATALLAAYPYLDRSRVAVWGWSGGGSMTLNLMFRYPGIYQTGMSVAPVTMLKEYDNIYEERYMGLLSENPQDYADGSAVNFASGLKGHLLLVQGSGDDNVHYQNSELLINELVRQGKPFQMMEYPNRSHGIYEGKGTREHLYSLLNTFLRTYTPAGAK